MKPKGRAGTRDEKSLILKRLEVVWNRAHDLRLGQLMHMADNLFYKEDYDLIKELEERTTKAQKADGSSDQ